MIIMSLDDRSGRIKHDSATTVTDQVARDIEADIDSGAIAPGHAAADRAGAGRAVRGVRG